MTTPRIWLAESLKFASSVGVYVFLDTFAPHFKGPFNVAGRVLTALVAGFIVFSLLDLILGRPVVQLTWSQGGHGIPDRRPHLLLDIDERRIIQAQLSMIGLTSLAKVFYWLSKRYVTMCIVTFIPRGVVRCLGQSMPYGTHMSRNVLTFSFKEGLWNGTNNIVQFSLSPQYRFTPPVLVDCHVELRMKGAPGFILPLFVKCDRGIDGFFVGR